LRRKGKQKRRTAKNRKVPGRRQKWTAPVNKKKEKKREKKGRGGGGGDNLGKKVLKKPARAKRVTNKKAGIPNLGAEEVRKKPREELLRARG